jgi:DNA-binding CsgD family transcriptional regulator
MIGHLNMLVMALAVGAGLATVTLSALLVRNRSTPYFRAFLTNLLLFNLLILTALVLRYLLKLWWQQEINDSRTALLGLLVALALLKLGWLYSFSALGMAMTSTVVQGFRRRFLVAAGLLAAIYCGATVSSAAIGWPQPGVASVILDLVIMGGAVTVAALLLVSARRSQIGPRRFSAALFAVFHLVFFVTATVSLLLGWFRANATPDSPQTLFNSILLILYNLFSLGWILHLQRSSRALDSLPDIFNEYGITSRESEIIMLICAGKTNQEIADQLFISLATVKDHNHNIFRKTAVRNRVELVNLFRQG